MKTNCNSCDVHDRHDYEANQMTLDNIKTIINRVPDPEIPVITLNELGIIRNIEINAEQQITITITPTYLGCPATSFIEQMLIESVTDEGYSYPTIIRQTSPVWTSDWISESAQQKLRDYGIAPPNGQSSEHGNGGKPKHCPRCNNTNIRLVSLFGSTPCKSMYQCNNCLEPFEYFKCH